MFEREGVKIAVLGLLTPTIPLLAQREPMEGT